MRRISFVATLVAAMSLLVVAQPAQAQTFVSMHAIPADGSTVSVALPPGAYELVVSGVYDYDSHRPGDQLADAECSTDYFEWRDPISQVNDVTGIPFSTWHRYRFIAGATAPAFGLNIPSFVGLPILNPDTNIDALDLAIGAHTALGTIPPITLEWAPTPPTLVNDADEIDLGCNEQDHTYAAPIVVLPGVSSVDFQIWDPTTVDNLGELTLEIYSLP